VARESMPWFRKTGNDANTFDSRVSLTDCIIAECGCREFTGFGDNRRPRIENCSSFLATWSSPLADLAFDRDLRDRNSNHVQL
jgi:hypothetical protein